jgi:hypothetical protein
LGCIVKPADTVRHVGGDADLPPVVLIYTAIVFRAPRGIITASFVEKNSTTLY